MLKKFKEVDWSARCGSLPFWIGIFCVVILAILPYGVDIDFLNSLADDVTAIVAPLIIIVTAVGGLVGVIANHIKSKK